MQYKTVTIDSRFNKSAAAFVLSLTAVVLLPFLLYAAPLWNVPVHVTQPDGSVHRLLASGDEYFNWLHDSEGHVVVQEPDYGWYVYALNEGGKAVPSQYIVGAANPPAVVLPVWSVPPSPATDLRELFGGRPAAAPAGLNYNPSGAINNLTIFIRFAGEDEFPEPISTFEALFNSTVAEAQSVYKYFKESSYQKLTVSSTFYPLPASGAVVSYQDVHPRNYYRPYNASTNPMGYPSNERYYREASLIASAVKAVKSQVPAELVIDKDGTGKIDSVVFVVRGEVDAWADLLWPHQSDIGNSGLFINGKELVRYVLELENSLRVGVLCHELMHTLGAPDLYHYTRDGISPAWVWDIMEYDINTPHACAYMKYRYMKWVESIPEITSEGTYSLNPLLMPSGNAYKIKSPNSDKEFFVVEYRKQEGPFESELPGEGLLIFRINAERDGRGNASGPPDEVYVMRPNGGAEENGLPWYANLNPETGMVAVNDSSNPRLYLSDGGSAGLMIYDVGVPGETISFKVKFCGCKGRLCGPDACGNWCGGCGVGMSCGTDGACSPCSPACEGRECGSDGCGGECGRCQGTEYCGDSGLCETGCTGSGGIEKWAAWSMAGNCPNRQSRSLLTASPSGELRWSLRVGDPITTTPTMDAKGTIYIGAGDGYYHAFGSDAREKWKFPAGGAEPVSEVVVTSAGMLVFGRQDNMLFVVDKDGKERWSVDAGSPIVAAPAVGDDGSIYFCSADGSLHKASPASESRGKLIWSYPAGGGCTRPPAIGPDGTVYYTNGDGKSLLAVGADGVLKWVVRSVFKLEETPVVLADGSIYLGDYDGTLYAVNPDGSVRWNYWISTSPLGGIAVGQDGTLYVPSENGSLYAVAPDPTPHMRWRYDTGTALYKAPVLDAQGNIFVGGRQQVGEAGAYVHALGPDGTFLWKFGTGGDVTGQTIVGLKGHIYAGSDDGIIYVLGAKCTSQCLGKSCGSDNCGKTCGEECPAAQEVCMTGGCGSDFRCEVVPSPAGSSCDDGDPCTADDRCDGAGKCISGGRSPSCSDGGTDGGGEGGGGGCSCSTLL